MPDTHSLPVWYELIADDPDAAQSFYSAVVGWTAVDSGMPEMDYRLLSAPDGGQIAGLMKRPEGMEPGPIWLPYFGVADVDASATAITAAGGTIQMEAQTVPGVGRFALATDPQHHPFYIMRGEDGQASASFLPHDRGKPGHAVWNELTAEDQDAAITFYTGLFGWHQDGAMPMGELGDYKFLLAGTDPIGGTMNEPPEGRRGWLSYFMVDDIDAAAARIAEAGGRIVQEPVEIPGGNYSLVADDPEAARFGLVGPRKA